MVGRKWWVGAVVLIVVVLGWVLLQQRVGRGNKEEVSQVEEQVKKLSPKEVQPEVVETEVKSGELEKELKQVEKELDELDVSGGSEVEEPVVDLNL